jgi:hypothetical protein
MVVDGIRPGRIVASTLGLMLLLSCSESPRIKTDPVLPSSSAPLPPAWLDHPQISKDEICAIGVSGPTYFVEDALAASKAQAYTELGRSIQVIVTSHMQTLLSGNGEASSFQLHEQAVLDTQTKLEKAEVRDQWVNPGGYADLGQKGTVYTHLCVANVRQQ